MELLQAVRHAGEKGGGEELDFLQVVGAQEFADQPELIRNESPAGLPESFRITLRDDVRPAGVAQNVRGLPGVDQVTTATKYSPTGIPGISLQEICSSKIHLP